uniref:Uncharacterized protein n=1 Tax=Anguilla anguilla TaxID=7936 RepID=A0A0E9WI91_ANGAN
MHCPATDKPENLNAAFVEPSWHLFTDGAFFMGRLTH